MFCFDGDAAGRRAAWRGLENSLGQLVDGKQVRFLFLPPEHDPDTFVRDRGKAAFENMLAGAVPLSRFLFDELASRVDLGSMEGRAKLLKEAEPLIKQVAAPMFSMMLRKQLAEVAGITQEELDREFQIKGRPAHIPRYQKREATISQPMRVLMLLLGNWSLCKKISDARLTLLEAKPDYSPVAELIKFARTHDQSSVAPFLEATRDSPHAMAFEEAASRTLTDVMDFDSAEADLEGILRKVEGEADEIEYRQLTSKTNKTEEEIARWRELNRRLAESKGVVA